MTTLTEGEQLMFVLGLFIGLVVGYALAIYTWDWVRQMWTEKQSEIEALEARLKALRENV